MPSYYTYNIVLNAPAIVVEKQSLEQFNIGQQTKLATAVVRQVYNGCTLASVGTEMAYAVKETDVQYNYNNNVYNLIEDNQLRIWINAVYSYIPPVS